jgi:hypothetical protein
MENLTPEPGNDFWPQYAPVSGVNWHPAPTTLAALVILAASVVISRVWDIRA